MVGAQAHRQKTADFSIQCKINIAVARHEGAHHARRADFHFLKITLCAARLIIVEDLIKLLRHVPEDILRRRRAGVGLNIDVAEIFIPLRQRELDGRLHGIGIDRGQIHAARSPRRAELSAEHHFAKLDQHAVFGAEDILEGAVGYTRCLYDFGNRCIIIPLVEEQSDARGQDSLLRFSAVVSAGDDDRSFLWNDWFMCQL